jgi:hypothetical protein
MAYIGNTPADKYQTLEKQSFSVSATTGYTLSYSVSSPQDIALFINNVRQNPNSSYTVSNTALTLSSATSSGDVMYAVFLGKSVGTIAPASNSVTSSMLVDNSVTTAKIANAVAGQFRFTSSFANANNGATEDITANLEENDTSYSRVGSAITQSSGIFTFPSTGIYLVTALVWFNPTSASSGVSLFIKATANNSSYVDLAKITTGSSGNGRPEVITANAIFDVTNVSTHKIKFATNGGDYITYQGSSTINNNSFTFLKLGDT